MKSKSVNLVRRQILLAGVGLVAAPGYALVATGPGASGSALIGEDSATMLEGLQAPVTATGSAPGVRQKLILSGRLTGLTGEAVSGAQIDLVAEKISTRSDADGRFMLITTVPSGQTLVLEIKAPSGDSFQEFLCLGGKDGPQYLSAYADGLPADASYEGGKVWRSSFSLHMNA